MAIHKSSLQNQLDLSFEHQLKSFISAHGSLSTFINYKKIACFCSQSHYSILIIFQLRTGTNNMQLFFIDLSKAFDTVGHIFLLKTLHTIGFNNFASEWFQNYFADRQHGVAIRNVRNLK